MKKSITEQLDEQLDIEFKKTLKKIASDIDNKVDEAIDRIERGSVKKVKLEIDEFANLVEVHQIPRSHWRSTNLPIVMDNEIASIAFGWLVDDRVAYRGKYNLSSHEKTFVFRFFDGFFLTKTGRLLRKCLFERFAERNIKLSFKRMDPSFLYDTGVRIKIVCNEKSTRRNL